MMRQNSGMQHIGIGNYDMSLLPYGLARLVRCVAVIGERFDVGLQIRNETVNFMHLILSQSLCGKQIQRARFGLIQNTLQHRQIVAKRLPAGCGSDEYDILTVADKTNCLSLMPV